MNLGKPCSVRLTEGLGLCFKMLSQLDDEFLDLNERDLCMETTLIAERELDSQKVAGLCRCEVAYEWLRRARRLSRLRGQQQRWEAVRNVAKAEALVFSRHRRVG